MIYLWVLDPKIHFLTNWNIILSTLRMIIYNHSEHEMYWFPGDAVSKNYRSSNWLYLLTPGWVAGKVYLRIRHCDTHVPFIQGENYNRPNFSLKI